MNKDGLKKYLIFYDGIYIDFLKGKLITPEGEKKIQGRKGLNCLQFLVSECRPVSIKKIYETVWGDDYDHDGGNCSIYVRNAISQIRIQLSKLIPSLDKDNIIHCRDKYYYFEMPKGVFASNSTDYNQNERFIHLNSPLNVMINYNYLIETSKGTPITVDLHNDSDTTLKNIDIAVYLFDDNTCIIKDTVPYIPPQSQYTYFIGHLNDNSIQFFSKDRISLERVDDISNFDVKIHDNLVLITAVKERGGR